MTTHSKLPAAIDAGVTLLAGSSAAFVLFAMPEALLSRILSATHLAAATPRLQPPIGDGVRLGLAVGIGLLALAFVWSLLKALDRGPARKDDAPAPAFEADPEAPRLRKADAHPDAPARRPLIAGRDLGEPLDLEPEQALDASDHGADTQEELLETQPEPHAAPEPEPAPLPPFLVAQAPLAQPEPAWEDEEEAEEEADTGAEGEASIVSLMQRFESGLSRKKQALPEPRPEAAPAPAAATAAPAPNPAAPEPPLAGPAPVGHRLRSAIADLQRVSGR